MAAFRAATSGTADFRGAGLALLAAIEALDVGLRDEMSGELLAAFMASTRHASDLLAAAGGPLDLVPTKGAC